MWSHSTEKFEKSPGAPARIAVGNTRKPSSFIINDHRLRVVLEGVTPATVELRAGAYEIEVYSEDLVQSSVVQAQPGSYLDASDLGLPIDTDIPVSCAQERDQFVAEAVSRASADLRDSRYGSGLVIIGLYKSAGSETSAAQRGTRLTLLDATYKKLHHVPTEPAEGVFTWHSGLEPGGYVVRLDAPGTVLEMPIWVSNEFQTILFLPLRDSWLVDRASVHMVPIGGVWTGFDLAATLIELALNNMRKGRRPFGESPPGFDIVSLARTNPTLGLIRTHDLWHFAPDSDEYRLLTRWLEYLVPGHPDLVATDVHEQLDFPPMLVDGIAAALGQIGGAANRIVEGSLLEASCERLMSLGPFSTWKVGKDGIPYVKPFATKTKVSLPLLVAVADFSSDVEKFRRLWILFVGTLVGYRLFRRPPEKAVEVLQRLGKRASVRRVALYLANLVFVGQSRQVRMILAGFNLQDLSEATSLPRSIVENALSEIRRGLGRTAIKGELMHPGEEPWKL